MSARKASDRTGAKMNRQGLRAEAIQGIARRTLIDEGTLHSVIANRMVEALTGHVLHASAPPGDGSG